MKKAFALFTLFTLLLALAACSTSKGTSDKSTSLSLEGRLLVGTLKLEDTSLGVTAAQAKQFLPLWETLQSMASSGTGAEAEVNAVVDQIQSTMTAGQLSSITAMALTRRDLQSVLADSGASTKTSATTSSSTANSAQMPSTGGMSAPAGGGPSGNPPSDMGGGMGASTSGTGSIDMAAQAASAQSTAVSPAASSSNQIPPALINDLVELLQRKVG